MERIHCPILRADVELTDERESHISVQHSDLLPEYRRLVIETLTDPDYVLRSDRDLAARRFFRWFPPLLGGKFVVAVVNFDATAERFWIVTAHITRRLPKGVIEWQKS
jgi:hypothetical protein